MAKYLIRYETYIIVDACNEDDAREVACLPGSNQDLLSNLQELGIEEMEWNL